MLDNVQIQNYRSLGDVDVPLRPLTVLVGPNDTGKTSFLRSVYELLRTHSQESLPQESLPQESIFDQRWKGVDCTVKIISKPYLVREESLLNVDELIPLPLRDENSLAELRFYRNLIPVLMVQLPAQGIKMVSQGFSEQGDAPVLGNDGSNVPSLLDYLLRRDRKRFFALTKTLQSLIPGLDDIEIATPTADTRRLDLVIEGGFRIPADEASAGVKLLIFFVALMYHPSPPRTILLEEPETGIHPRRLRDVMDLLRSITRGEFGGHAAQVILTTHSPYLLDMVDLETDQVLVFRRNEDGSRSAEPADRERLKTFLDEFMLGEVWFNQGEEGLVAKRT